MNLYHWLLIMPAIGVSTLYYTLKFLFGSLFGKSVDVVFYREIKKWSRTVLKICRIDVITVGSEHLATDNTYIYIPNHTHYIDIPLLVQALHFDNIHFVYRQSLQKVPVLGSALKRSPFIPIIRENSTNAFDGMIKAGILLKTRSVIMFPEGTRSGDGVTAKFKRGAFLLAHLAGKELVPIAMSGVERVFKTLNGFRFPRRKVFVQINPPIGDTPMERIELKPYIQNIHNIISTQVQANKIFIE